MWGQESLDWCLGQFGSPILTGAVLVPDASFFPGTYTGSPQDVETILTTVCNQMGVDRQSVILEMMPTQTDRELLAHLPAYGTSFQGEAGHYQRREDGFVVAVSDDQLDAPVALTAVIAHELGHVRLLGEARIDPGRADGEALTDLVAVFLGLGVFNANASFNFHTTRGGWGTSRLGYLSEQMFGYALAYHARMRAETWPSWAKYLDVNPRVYMRQATRYLKATNRPA